jgi:hypothetical protein
VPAYVFPEERSEACNEELHQHFLAATERGATAVPVRKRGNVANMKSEE